jgi:Cu2+-exporting ATPase
MHEGHGPAEHAGHDEHAGHSVAMFRDRFWLSLLLTVPVLVWSEMVQEWLGYTAPSFPLSVRIPAILGTVIFVYGGMPFLKGGVQELRDRQPGMMLLISLAIVVAFVASLASEFDWLDLVGARPPDRRDAPRALAGDEGHRPGIGSTRGTRSPAPRRG